ncbi:MAG: LON peptidase substrate-binding domain-containing protein, partial [Acidobacteriota bacterium]
MTKEPAPRPAAPDRLPVWTVEERVVFPLALSTLAFPLPAGKALLEEAHASGDYMAVCPAAKGGRISTKAVGTVVLILRLAPSDAAGVNLLLVQGVSRARLALERRRGDVRYAHVEPLPDALDPASRLTATAQMREVLQRLDQLSGGGRGIPPETREFLSTIEEPGRLADLVASQLDLPFDRARRLLETPEVVGRLTLLLSELRSEVEIQSLQDKLNRQTREEMDRRQKEYFLRQQLETIQAELSGADGGDSGEAGYKKRLESLDLPAPVREVLEKEISRLSRYGPFSEELSHLRAFLDLVFDLPWGKTTEDVLDLSAAQRNLDRDHYGLKKVKDRILEYMAVCKLKGGHTGTLFCFVGPPGVGKTSLGRA